MMTAAIMISVGGLFALAGILGEDGWLQLAGGLLAVMGIALALVTRADS